MKAAIYLPWNHVCSNSLLESAFKQVAYRLIRKGRKPDEDVFFQSRPLGRCYDMWEISAETEVLRVEDVK